MGLSNALRGWFSSTEPADETDLRESDRSDPLDRSDADSDSDPDSDSDSGSVSDRGPEESSASAVVIYECRNCGTTVSSETSVCPACETSTIAEYRIE